MWKRIFIAILSFSALIAKAQRVKTYNTKEFQYRAAYTATAGSCSVDTISIFRLPGKQLIQKIIPPQNKCYCGVKYEPLTVEDYNFDNHADISIIRLIPKVGKPPYFHWLYNAATNNFVRNAQLEKITAPVVDRENKCIMQEWKESETLFGVSYYTWEDGELTMTQQTQQEYVDRLDGTGYVEETTKKLVRGKMKVVSKTKKKWE